MIKCYKVLIDEETHSFTLLYDAIYKLTGLNDLLNQLKSDGWNEKFIVSITRVKKLEENEK